MKGKFKTNGGTIMNDLKLYQKPERPIRVLQFGEGGFLRGFVDWMLQIVNENMTYFYYFLFK